MSSFGRVVFALSTVLAAAIAISVARSPSSSPSSVAVVGFDVQPYGSDRSRPPGSPWPIGDSYVVRFTLEADGYPVLVHVGSTGEPSVLFPGRGLRPVAGETVVQVPPPSVGQAWLVEGTPGPQWFVIAATRDSEVEMSALTEELVEETRGQDPIKASQQVAKVLRRRVGDPFTYVILLTEAG